MANARLRAKTGCFTCRKRRVKCGEERPECNNCRTRGRQCHWPSQHDLTDRRHRDNSQRHTLVSDDGSDPSGSSPSGSESQEVGDYRRPTVRPLDATVSTGITDHELRLVHQFTGRFLPVLLLPSLGPRDYDEFESQMISMMLRYKCVKYAVLAGSASNRYMLSNEVAYQKRALAYYSQAMHEVGACLSDMTKTGQSPGNETLIAVVFLYLYNLWSADMSLDARKHVAGAMKLLNVRYDGGASLCAARTFERVIAESVMYQALLLATRSPFNPYFNIDSSFFSRTADILEPGAHRDFTAANNSPVLGAPISLYRLIMDTIDLHKNPRGPAPGELIRMRAEMGFWESLVVNEGTPGFKSPLTNSLNIYVVTLYILAASLLLEWVVCSSANRSHVDVIALRDQGYEGAGGGSSWQIDRAIAIVRKPEAFRVIARCFLASWPMQILGYAVGEEGDVATVRSMLKAMRARMGYGEIQRILEELEEIWEKRKGATTWECTIRTPPPPKDMESEI